MRGSVEPFEIGALRFEPVTEKGTWVNIMWHKYTKNAADICVKITKSTLWMFVYSFRAMYHLTESFFTFFHLINFYHDCSHQLRKTLPGHNCFRHVFSVKNRSPVRVVFTDRVTYAPSFDPTFSGLWKICIVSTPIFYQNWAKWRISTPIFHQNWAKCIVSTPLFWPS